MLEYMELGPTPTGEDCEQAGPDCDHIKARKECKAFINQLIRKFGQPPAGGFYKIKTFPHDFGSYQEVCLFYTETEGDEDPYGDVPESKSEAYAYFVDSNIPENWDDEAKKELDIHSSV